MDRWVWTTFNEHQWDLNWANPQVFLEMTEVMLFLANRGVEVLRLDAVGLHVEADGHALPVGAGGATCCCRRCAPPPASPRPRVIHLEEAIVSPAEMMPYLGRGEHDGKEGNLAYHNSLMVQFWSALAARDTQLMTHVMRHAFPAGADQRDLRHLPALPRRHRLGGHRRGRRRRRALTGRLHRAFLSDFYEGVFPGSRSRAGALFQVNPETGDKRISGTCASLAGLETGARGGDRQAIDRAIDRILMGHALIACYGGIPLIYMGDEIALLNDYGYSRRSPSTPMTAAGCTAR